MEQPPKMKAPQVPEDQQAACNTFFDWAQRITTLGYEWLNIDTSFMNCYSNKNRRWWSDVLANGSFDLFVDLRYFLEDLSIREVPALYELPLTISSFFYNLEVNESLNATIQYFKIREQQVHASHSGSRQPNPVLTEPDKAVFKVWYNSVRQLLSDIEEGVAITAGGVSSYSLNTR